MSELRKDPIVGRWVIIATDRARRPGNIVESEENHRDTQGCPYCPGSQHGELTELYRVSAPGKEHSDEWLVRVVNRQKPILKEHEHFSRHAHGLYDVANGYGRHEVVIETPQHIYNTADLSVEQIRHVIDAYVVRFDEMKKDERIKVAVVFKNYGRSAGASPIAHARSQIIGLPINPMRIKEKLVGAKRYYDYHERCLFCDLIRQEYEEKQRVLLETEHFVAVTPFAGRFLFETWVLPKKHHCDFNRGVIGQEGDLAKILKEVLLRLKVGLNDPAYNYVLHTAPFKRKAVGSSRWRTIKEDYHWHLEVMPRLTRVAGFEKGTGFYISAIPPEYSAEFLKEVEI